MPTWEQLLIRTTDLDCQRLLSYWRWLLQKDYHPIVMTAFRDWFLLDQDGSVHFLDLVAGSLSKVAESGEEFKQVMGLPEKLDEWFMAEVVQSLLDAGIVLEENQCYGYKIPPVLGAKIEVANIELTDIAVHQGILSQIHEQTRNLPEGTRINKVLIDGEEPDSWELVRDLQTRRKKR
jgi:hypothetical protein